MSLSDNYKPVKYIGNGATKDFSFGFNMIDRDYCRVFLQDIETGQQTQKTIEVDYTLNFGDDGGTVSINVAPTENEYIVIYRDVDLSQKSDFRVGEGFSAVKIEDEFDKQMAAIQQMEDGLNRAPKVAEGYTINLTLPEPNAGKTLIWDEEENGFKNSTVDVDKLEQATKQYLEESKKARDEAQGFANDAKESATSSAQSATNASNSANLAKDWATKTDGTVDGFEYSAKHYALQSATNASNGANLAKDWATKTDGTVDGFEYSAKHYALEAAQSAASIDPSKFDTKANTDLSNVNPVQAFKDSTIEWGIPDYSSSSSISFTKGETWTVPYDCELYYCISVASVGGVSLKLRLNNSSGQIIFLAGSETLSVLSSDRIRLKKGTVVYPEIVPTKKPTVLIITPLVGVN